jgi:hypothetical protein
MKSYTYRSPELEVYITVQADNEDDAADTLDKKIRDVYELGINLPHLWSYKLYSVNDLL